MRSTVTVGGGRSPLSFADIMKAFLCLCAFLFVLPCGVFAADGFSLSITNTTVANQGRRITVDMRVSEGVSLSKETTLLVVVGETRAGRPADEFGLPQNFALKGTSHEIGRGHFRVEVALPLEKIKVTFMLVKKKSVLYEQARWL